MAIAFSDFELVDHLTAVAKNDQAPGGLWCPCCVAIDPATNHIYVTEGGYDFARVSVFSESGDYLNSYNHELMKSLYGIAIHANYMYVTDWEVHAVFHFKIDADFRLVARLGSRGSGVRQFNAPQQLSISTNGDLYIADRDNNRIQILDSSLHPIREVTHPSMYKPCDVKLTTDEMYVLSRSIPPCVHVFNHTGHKIRSLTCEGAQPFFFCLDTKKNLFISDWKSQQIKIFSNEGALLHTIGKPGNRVGKFSGIHGLALTSNLKLVTVSWNCNYRLQIFSSL